MPRRSIERSVPGTGNVIDMKTGKTVKKPALPVVCERVRFFRERMGIEQKELAKMIGVTGNAVSNWENGRGRPDLNLIPELCEALHITMYDLFGLKDPTEQYSVALKIFDEKLSVRDVEKLVKNLHKPAKPKKEKVVDDQTLQLLYQDIEEKLKQRLGTKVTITSKGNGEGKMEIEFYNNDDLDRLVGLMGEK